MVLYVLYAIGVLVAFTALYRTPRKAIPQIMLGGVMVIVALIL